MGRDAPFSAKMNHAHLHQGAILGHPSWHVPMALFLQVSSSLAPMQVYWRMLHCPAAKPRWLLGFGREVFFPRHKCSVERTESLMGFLLLGYIYLYILLLCYIAICLYIYIGIALFVYSVVCLFPYCMLEAWKYCFLYIYRTFGHIRYSIFRNCHIFRLLIMSRITVVAVFLDFIELSYYLFLISWQYASGLRSFLPTSLMNVSAKSYLYILSFFRSWWQRIVSWFQCWQLRPFLWFPFYS